MRKVDITAKHTSGTRNSRFIKPADNSDRTSKTKEGGAVVTRPSISLEKTLHLRASNFPTTLTKRLM
jgi:hypothetical protein